MKNSRQNVRKYQRWPPIAPGMRFGRWIVLDQIIDQTSNKKWKCRCNCGSEKSVTQHNLNTGWSKSCGCFAKEVNSKPKNFPIERTIKKFWDKIEKTESCWLWKGSKDGCGYGNFIFHGKCTHANRVSWKLFRGEIPKGLYVCHTCDNPSCVNPDHLFLGTQKQNMIDCSKKGRMGNRKGTANANAKLTEQKVIEIRFMSFSGMNGGDICRKFGLSKSTLNNIKHRKTWKHI